MPWRRSALRTDNIVCWESGQNPIAEWLPSMYPPRSGKRTRETCFVVVKYPKRFTAGSRGFPVELTDELEGEFRRLVTQWKKATMFSSFAARSAEHPDYQAIINLGIPAIPLLLQELNERGGHWFIALQAITGENPVAPEDAGNVPKMTKAWIEWGRRKGHLR